MTFERRDFCNVSGLMEMFSHVANQFIYCHLQNVNCFLLVEEMDKGFFPSRLKS